MKKAVLISGIITLVAYSILAIVFSIVGIAYLISNDMANSDPGAIPMEELRMLAAIFLILAGYFLLGVIFSGVMLGKRNSNMGKGAGITLGIFGILFGAIFPGIFFIADSAKSRS